MDTQKAKRLALLLAQSVMLEEQKAAWLNVLPLMSEAQVNQLMGIMQHEQQSYQEVSKAFFQDLGQLNKDMTATLDQLAAKERQEIEQYIQQKLNGTSWALGTGGGCHSRHNRQRWTKLAAALG